MRAQTGPEFIILFGFLLFAFLIFLTVVQNKVLDQQEANRRALFESVADRVEEELLRAAQVRTGYMREFSLPRTLRGEPYNVSIEGKRTIVVGSEQSENEYLRFLSFNATLVPGGNENLLVPGEWRVIVQRNESGLYIRKDCVAAGKGLPSCS